nr:hypothetical protein KitaXyl93_71160 [Kitasatospora sp. Xyl93]
MVRSVPVIVAPSGRRSAPGAQRAVAVRGRPDPDGKSYRFDVSNRYIVTLGTGGLPHKGPLPLTGDQRRGPLVTLTR